MSLLDWVEKEIARIGLGGQGSGNFKHKGRPGKQGGSAKGSGIRKHSSAPFKNKQLFHYTSEASAASIQANGFTVKEEGYSALLGRGIFFTDESGSNSFSKDFGKHAVKAHATVKDTLSIEGGYLGYFNWVLDEAERRGLPSPNPEDITSIVRSAGYDSVFIQGSQKGNIYIVFDAKNVKIDP
jgi:hypothetical protein